MMPLDFSRGQEGWAVVEVKTKVSGKGDAAYQQAKTKILVLDQHLRSCIDLLEHAPSSIAIWKAGSAAKKLEKTIAALQRERQELPRVIGEMLELVGARSNEIETLKHRLNESEKALRASKAAEAAAKSGEAAATSQVEDLQSKLKKAEAAATAQASELQRKLQALEAENRRLQANVTQLSQTREAAATRFQELTAEYQGIAEKAEREIRRLEEELKKANDAREVAVENSEKVKVLQRRYDSMKSLADAGREATAAAKKQAEQATEKLAKAAEIHARRLAETRAARDSALQELDTLRKEHNALHEAFLAAGGAERQAALVRQATSGAANAATDLVAAPAVVPAVAAASVATGPRHVLRSRHGWCIHARPCGAANDINKLVVLPYEDASGLEELVREHGLFLCGACTAGGFFKAA